MNPQQRAGEGATWPLFLPVSFLVSDSQVAQWLHLLRVHAAGWETVFATLKVKSMAKSALLLGRVAQAGGKNVSLGAGKSAGDGRNELWNSLCTFTIVIGLTAVGWWGHEVAITEEAGAVGGGTGWTNGAEGEGNEGDRLQWQVSVRGSGTESCGAQALLQGRTLNSLQKNRRENFWHEDTHIKVQKKRINQGIFLKTYIQDNYFLFRLVIRYWLHGVG